ncbi:MAG TPA: sugar ABC transporter permease [Acidimicrobiia bacterium]
MRILLAATVIVLFPVVLVAIVGLADRGLRAVLSFKALQQTRPWIWITPGLVFMGTVLVYPLLDTLRLSLHDASGREYVGLENYAWIFTAPGVVDVLRNTAVWVTVIPLVTLLLGLVASVLIDRVRYESFAKSVLVMPTAISFVAAAVMWSLVFKFRPAGLPQRGTLNALWTLLGKEPITWTVNPSTANAALVFIVIWSYLGFVTIVLSAALKGIPDELLDAARVDGASEWQVFRYVTLHQLKPAVIVVTTTMVVWVLKTFDVVFVFTQGRYGTDIIGVRVYNELFAALNWGRGSALATMLFFAILPIMVINIRRLFSTFGAST